MVDTSDSIWHPVCTNLIVILGMGEESHDLVGRWLKVDLPYLPILTVQQLNVAGVLVMAYSFHLCLFISFIPLVASDCEALEAPSSSKCLLQSKWSPKAMVFYQVFANSSDDLPRVSQIAQEQLTLVDPSYYELWINAVGAIRSISDLALDPLFGTRTKTKFVHHPEGQETLSLHDLWSYCRSKDVHPNQAKGLLIIFVCFISE